MFQWLPPTPPEPPGVIAVDRAPDLRGLRLYRAPWERPAVQALPEKIVISRPPLPRAPLRVAVQRQYWFGPVSDFFLLMGFIALGGGYRDDPGSAWVMESAFPGDLGLLPKPPGPPFQVQPTRWEYPPLQVKVSADPDGTPK